MKVSRCLVLVGLIRGCGADSKVIFGRYDMSEEL